MTVAGLPVTGYFGPVSGRPDEILTARVTDRVDGKYRAHLARVIRTDSNLARPRMRFEDLVDLFDRAIEGRRERSASALTGVFPPARSAIPLLRAPAPCSSCST